MQGIPDFITVEAPLSGVYTPDIPSPVTLPETPNVPIGAYRGFLRPGDDKAARALGAQCADAVKANFIANFERSPAWCAAHGESEPDLMAHVSTFLILDGVIYMTYYANTGTADEDHTKQEARLAYCPADDPADLTVIRLQKVGDTLDGKVITHVYDTILLYKGGDELYLLWTAAPDGNYYRLYRTFNVKTKTLGPIRVHRFRVGGVENDFSITGMKAALNANGIPYKPMWNDIGIMQKLSSRVEGGEVWYYTGTYSGNFNAIIKSRDFITWEFVALPDFPNNSLWENAVYALGEKVYYFVRQQECQQGFLTAYHLTTGQWETPTLITDAQSRSDFVFYRGDLFLIHAPLDRNGFGIVKIDRDDPAKSTPVLVAEMDSSLFYPFVRVVGDDAYISYTDDRKHITLSKFSARKFLLGEE